MLELRLLLVGLFYCFRALLPGLGGFRRRAVRGVALREVSGCVSRRSSARAVCGDVRRRTAAAHCGGVPRRCATASEGPLRAMAAAFVCVPARTARRCVATCGGGAFLCASVREGCGGVRRVFLRAARRRAPRFRSVFAAQCAGRIYARARLRAARAAAIRVRDAVRVTKTAAMVS